MSGVVDSGGIINGFASKGRTADANFVKLAIDGLSLEEKAYALAGIDMWRTRAVPSIGLESLQLSDGPNGVRGELFDERDIATCTPCGSAIGATWDVDIAQKIGAIVGNEALQRGVNVLLGPNLNIQRSPLGGRGFECFGEDPILTGELGSAWIKGVQSCCVAATPKHYVCNDSETDRTSVDCVVDERSLREIYFIPFERAVNAGAHALMTGYNQVNGQYCATSADLVVDVLKTEWRFEGLVMSDWFASGDTVGFVQGGLDLEMPGPPRQYGSALVESVRSGEVDERLLNDKIERLMRIASRVGPQQQSKARFGGLDAKPSVREQMETSAAASFVLLRNDRSLLPLQLGEINQIAVIGPNAIDPCLQGGGSAHVAIEVSPTPLEALRGRCTPHQVKFAKGCTPREALPGLHLMNSDAERIATNEFTFEVIRSTDGSVASSEIRSTSKFIWFGQLRGLEDGEPGSLRVVGSICPPVTGSYCFSVRGSAPCRIFIGGEEVASFAPLADDPVHALFSIDESRASIDLAANETVSVVVELDAPPQRFHLLSFGCLAPEAGDSIGDAVCLASESDTVVLVVGTSEDTECESADRESTTLPGDQEELVRRVVAANPKCVVVVNAASAVDLTCADGAAAILYTWFGGDGYGNALADVLVGTREPGGRLPMTIAREHSDYAAWRTTPDENCQLHYDESMFVGYRHFDNARLEPAFCFGHGLSYTEFEYEYLEIENDHLSVGEPCLVVARVRNAGRRPGKEVVQVYVSDVISSLPRPPRELKAFTAVWLDVGEVRQFTFTLSERDFSFWDPGRQSWYLEPGDFEISVGRSSRDLRKHHLVNISDPARY
jgi:beta-glucosidase